MNWVSATARLLLIAVAAGLVGWVYGYPLESVLVALALIMVFWLYQVHRVQRWLRNPERAPPDTFGIWADLTSSISAIQRNNTMIQEQLQSTVEYLQASLGSMRDGVVMVDETGAIKWCNGAVAPLLGLRYPADTGQALTNLVRAPEFKDYFNKGDYSEPLQYTTAGDRTVHLRVEITRFGKGERLLFVRDVSAAVRTEQIRRDFVANVSHELRTPLTVISGYLGTLTGSRDLPPALNRPLEQMSQQAGRMENLLKDLLLLSRIESGERLARRELVDMRGLLQELRDEFSCTRPDTPLTLDLATEKKILGDYRELYSAVSNLANNAIKYSRPGSPVNISWRYRDGWCVLSVRDQGIGVDQMHIPRLTERFYRVDDSRSSATGGTGLGLAIVKHVASAHDAQLKIESELGKGSTFSLIFPPGE